MKRGRDTTLWKVIYQNDSWIARTVALRESRGAGMFGQTRDSKLTGRRASFESKERRGGSGERLSGDKQEKVPNPQTKESYWLVLFHI